MSFQGEGNVTTTRKVVVYIGIAGRVLLYAHFKGMHLLSVNCMFSDSVLASARRKARVHTDETEAFGNVIPSRHVMESEIVIVAQLSGVASHNHAALIPRVATA